MNTVEQNFELSIIGIVQGITQNNQLLIDTSIADINNNTDLDEGYFSAIDNLLNRYSIETVLPILKSINILQNTIYLKIKELQYAIQIYDLVTLEEIINDFLSMCDEQFKLLSFGQFILLMTAILIVGNESYLQILKNKIKESE